MQIHERDCLAPFPIQLNLLTTKLYRVKKLGKIEGKKVVLQEDGKNHGGERDAQICKVGMLYVGSVFIVFSPTFDVYFKVFTKQIFK